MLIQVYIKNEPLQNCDLLIAREDAVLSIPVAGLQDLLSNGLTVKLVRTSENMAMKSAILAANAIRNAGSASSPVQIACPDKNILDGICSMEYEGPDGSPVKCAPMGAKSQAPPRVRNRAKPKPAEPAGPVQPSDAPSGPEPGTDEQKDVDTPDADMAALTADPEFVNGAEVNLANASDTNTKEKPDPAVTNAPRIMAILKEQGVPSGHIPGVLEALREAMDANITLPMQIKLKLARDQAADGLESEKTAELVKPRFDELKALLKEIDENSPGK